MRVLVTGSEGGIGRWVFRTLIAAGHTVKTSDVIAAKVTQSEAHTVCDLRDFATVRDVVDGVEAVLHLGAIPGDWPGHDPDVMTTNIMGTWNVLQACVEAGIKRAVCFSSIQGIGLGGGWRRAVYLPIDDDYPHLPKSAYQLSKHLGEETCKHFADVHDMNIVCLRPVLTTQPETYKHWNGGPDDTRNEWAVHDYWNYVDVRDVSEAARLALTADIRYDAFLLTDDITCMDVPTEELVREHYADTPRKQELEVYLAANPYRSLTDCTHAKTALGWQPQHHWLTR